MPLPPSDNRELLLSQVGHCITALEQNCNDIELSLRERNWERLAQVLGDARRLMHGFDNAMSEAQPLRNDEFDQTVFARLQVVYGVRAEQMKRLEVIHGGIGERLRSLSHWKQYARSIAGPDAGKSSAALFQDIR